MKSLIEFSDSAGNSNNNNHKSLENDTTKKVQEI